MRIRTALSEEHGDAPTLVSGEPVAPETPKTPETPASPDASPYAGLLADDGSFTEGWLDKLPADFDPYRATLANYPSMPALAKALYENKQLAREKAGLKIPGEDATPEQQAEFRKALGVPDKPEDYGIERPKDLPEGVEWDDGLAKGFAETAHKLGMPPGAAKGLMEWFNARQIEAAKVGEQQFEATRAEQIASLRSEFGAKYEQRLADAKRAAITLGLDPDHSPVFYDPDGVKAFARIADMLGEDKLVSGNAANVLSPTAQAKDIMTNEANPFHARYRKGDSEIVGMVNSLMERGG